MADYDHISERLGLFFVEGDLVYNSGTNRTGIISAARTDKHDMVHVIDTHTGSERNWHPHETIRIP